MKNIKKVSSLSDLSFHDLEDKFFTDLSMVLLSDKGRSYGTAINILRKITAMCRKKDAVQVSFVQGWLAQRVGNVSIRTVSRALAFLENNGFIKRVKDKCLLKEKSRTVIVLNTDILFSYSGQNAKDFNLSIQDKMSDSIYDKMSKSNMTKCPTNNISLNNKSLSLCSSNLSVQDEEKKHTLSEVKITEAIEAKQEIKNENHISNIIKKKYHLPTLELTEDIAEEIRKTANCDMATADIQTLVRQTTSSETWQRKFAWSKKIMIDWVVKMLPNNSEVAKQQVTPTVKAIDEAVIEKRTEVYSKPNTVAHEFKEHMLKYFGSYENPEAVFAGYFGTDNTNIEFSDKELMIKTTPIRFNCIMRSYTGYINRFCEESKINVNLSYYDKQYDRDVVQSFRGVL
jgi:hypothetical protein